MEFNKSSITSLPSLPSYPQHKPAPDVPQDIEDDHFNDLNWDYSQSDWSSSTESLELSNDKYSTSDMSLEHGETVRIGRSHSAFGVSQSEITTTTDLEYNDDSPYAEVRAAVSNTDEPLMPVNTIRMWFLGLVLTGAISAINQFFSMRYPSVYITGLVAQLVSFILGKAMDRYLPNWRIKVFGYSISLNPGPFNIKEHTLITVMVNVTAQGVYATDIIATQRIYFNQHWGIGYQMMLCLSSQIIGFAFAGMARQFLVWPSAMIWPGALVNAALFSTLHKNYGKRETKHMSREKFFGFVVLGSFCWFWLPGYLFTALSIFNWVCWIAPNNVVVNQLFGYSTGLGMGFITFDWSMISFVGSPLVVPWWAQVNAIFGFVFFFWMLSPILYYTNAFYSKFLPMSAPIAFDNTGAPYDPSRVIQDGQFNLDMYKAYSPLYLPVTFLVQYGISFAGMTAVVVHTILWYRRDITRQLRRSLRDQKDVHSRLMLVYPEVPMWWYGSLGVAAFVMAVITVEVFDTKLPIWALLLALIVAMIFVVPVGMVQAITNQQVGLQIFAELIVGYVLPGRPVAMMVFKTFSFISMHQAVFFLGDLKLGHYMKIPPRTMFMAQVMATALSVVISVAVQAWMFAHIPDLCTPDQPAHLTCPSTSVFATAAVVWGGIGPSRLFSPGSLYYPITFFFLIGAILPVPFYLLARKYPQSFWRYVNIPVMLAGIEELPPASGINLTSWFMTGAIFQFFMRRYHFRWWMRYNYILSAGLDSGLALALIVIFFALQFPKGGINLNWWGNTVWQNTADFLGLPLILLDPGKTFGPTTWS